MKLVVAVLLCAGMAFGSGTIKPKTGGARCATSVLEGTIVKVDAGENTFAVAAKSGTREFKATPDTQFRIPGATKEQLKEAPLSKVSQNARVKVSYCTAGGRPVEVKVER